MLVTISLYDLELSSLFSYIDTDTFNLSLAGLKSFAALINDLNFRTWLSESIYMFFNNKRCYFAMQVATVPRKLAVDP